MDGNSEVGQNSKAKEIRELNQKMTSKINLGSDRNSIYLYIFPREGLELELAMHFFFMRAYAFQFMRID